MSRGFDYGMGNTNIDKDNGIRYGVIPVNEVSQAWSDGSESYYPCESCKESAYDVEEGIDCSYCEPSSYYVDNAKYQAESSDGIDIFITKAPYYTLCQFCSPCAPGAGYVLNTVEDGVKTYCFGHDWFEDGKAPYPVYRVKDDSLVEE